MRQLRQLPVAAACARRQGDRAKAVVLRLSHRAALRRDAPDRCAGRPHDRPGQAVRARQTVGVRHRPRAQREAVARRAAPTGGDGPSRARQRSLWRAEADGERARRPEGRDRGDAARGDARRPHPRQPDQIEARRSARRHPPRPADPAIQPCSPRCGRGVRRWRASAACRPMWCCTTPPSTASRPRARRRSDNCATSRASATRSSNITATS